MSGIDLAGLANIRISQQITRIDNDSFWIFWIRSGFLSRFEYIWMLAVLAFCGGDLLKDY